MERNSMGCLPSHGENGSHLSKDTPLDILMTSFLSAKDFIVPMVSSTLVKGVGKSNLNMKIILANSVPESSRNDATFEEQQEDNMRSLRSENHNRLINRTCNSANEKNCLAVCLEYFSNLPSWNGLFYANSCGDLLGGKKPINVFTVQEGLGKQLSGLSLQGLSTLFPAYHCVLNPKHNLEKISDSFCVAGTGQKSVVACLFQTMMEHCIFASSSISKHVAHVMPWNDSLQCAISDSENRMKDDSSNNTLCINATAEHNKFFNIKGHEQIKNYLNLTSLGFAKVGGDPSTGTPAITTNAEKTSSHGSSNIFTDEQDESNNTPAGGVFKMAIPNMERLRTVLSTIPSIELMELVPQLGRTSQDFPDKKKLFSVQDFFRYTEVEGRRFFEELDRDNDGQVTLEDLEAAMRKRRLPQQYAREFLRRTRKHLFSKSIGWKEFHSLMEQKEPMMLRAYNSLSLSKSGTLQKSQVLLSLRNAGLPATEENAEAMMRCLDPDARGSVAYGQFRNFMLLLPPERLGDDPRMVWYEAATVVPMSPPVAVPAEGVLKSALAGGLTCALSTSLMHPIDTMKTRVQASSTLSFPELVSRLPEIGVRGLYRGSIPAILGQFSSHGLRTGIFEASKLLLTNLAPGVPEIQVRSLSSFCSTILGTAIRIPCEVLKQRLQAGLFDNVGDAIAGTWQQDGPGGFFRGTGATLCREVPFYVAGMAIYEEAKKMMQQLLKRELAPWETIAVGAISGGLAAVCTTPFDVMKTRTMTAAPGVSTSMSKIALTIIQEEGLLGLFKGAVPRFFWIAPLGAMNFAGYELAKRAMEKQDKQD